MMLMEQGNLLNREETIRYLGYQSTQPEESMLREIKECEHRFLQVAKPQFDYKVYELIENEGELYTKDSRFHLIGDSLKKHLQGASYVAFGCATLGEMLDGLIENTQKTSMLEALLLDAIANASVEQVRKALELQLSIEYPKYHINWLFGIGYGDVPLSMQHGFLKQIKAKETLGVTANAQCILHPLKTITGFVGIFKHPMNMKNSCPQRNCSSCSVSKSCIYKKINT